MGKGGKGNGMITEQNSKGQQKRARGDHDKKKRAIERGVWTTIRGPEAETKKNAA